MKTMTSKFLHIPSGVIFINRKQAVRTMSISRYRKALKNKEFIFNYEPEAEPEPEAEDK